MSNSCLTPQVFWFEMYLPQLKTAFALDAKHQPAHVTTWAFNNNVAWGMSVVIHHAMQESCKALLNAKEQKP